MILSKGFWQTYKEVPKEAEIPSHQLMIRAGLVQKASSGLFNYLPMGLRTIKKVEKIIREEMDKIGSLELLMTVVTPGELWQETGRWQAMGDLMVKFVDKGKRDLCLSPTNEEAVVDIFRKTINSYKELPLTLYQINTKFRDEIRPRFGLMRGREFIMKDAYSFHMTKECLDQVYEDMYQAYCRIFQRMGLEFIPVEADGGAITGGGKAKTHEFQVLANSGEDSIIFCPSCRYAANVEAAESKRVLTVATAQGRHGSLLDTPNKKTIKDVCDFLNVDPAQSIKSLIYKAVIAGKDELIAAYLIGDDEVNEIKLKQVLGAAHIRPAGDEEIASAGLVKGFIGHKKSPSISRHLFEQSLNVKTEFLMGANEADKHVWIDLSKVEDAKQVYSFRSSKAGDLCLKCNQALQNKRGIEVGHIFQLGDKYSRSMEASVLDQSGKKFFPLMGCYGVGVTRTVAAAIEQHYDDKGIVWPASIAPYHVYLAVLAKDQKIKDLGKKLYQDLSRHNIEVVMDDRNVGAGFMFKDSELLGLPIRVVLGERDFLSDGTLELKMRKSGESRKIKLEEVISAVQEELGKLI